MAGWNQSRAGELACGSDTSTYKRVSSRSEHDQLGGCLACCRAAWLASLSNMRLLSACVLALLHAARACAGELQRHVSMARHAVSPPPYMHIGLNHHCRATVPVELAPLASGSRAAKPAWLALRAVALGPAGAYRYWTGANSAPASSQLEQCWHSATGATTVQPLNDQCVPYKQRRAQACLRMMPMLPILAASTRHPAPLTHHSLVT
jgi:hypothetical protein